MLLKFLTLMCSALLLSQWFTNLTKLLSLMLQFQERVRQPYGMLDNKTGPTLSPDKSYESKAIVPRDDQVRKHQLRNLTLRS